MQFNVIQFNNLKLGYLFQILIIIQILFGGSVSHQRKTMVLRFHSWPTWVFAI